MLHELDRSDFLECLPVRERIDSDKSYKVFCGSLGNFSVVVIQTQTGRLYSGVSKRNPCDIDTETGVCIAAVRAWRDYLGKDPGYCRQRPVSRRQSHRAAAISLLENRGY